MSGEAAHRQTEITRNTVSSLETHDVRAHTQQKRHQPDGTRRREIEEEAGAEARKHALPAADHERDAHGEDEGEVGATVAESDVRCQGELEHAAHEGEHEDAALVPVPVGYLHRSRLPYSFVPVVAPVVVPVVPSLDDELALALIDVDASVDVVSWASAEEMSSEDACWPSVSDVMTRTSS